MGWYDFSPPYSFLNGCCVASIGAAWGGSGSMWIPKELMQPSHTSDITHRAFQLYPGNLSKGTGWNMHQTWKHMRSSYHSVTSLDFGKTFRSKQLRKTPSPFIEIKKLSMNKKPPSFDIRYPNLPGSLAIDHRLWKKSLKCKASFLMFRRWLNQPKLSWQVWFPAGHRISVIGLSF